jgi:predicted nuclease with TOPRIM domain
MGMTQIEMCQARINDLEKESAHLHEAHCIAIADAQDARRVANELQSEVERLKFELKYMKLQRDVLALNRNGRDSQVYVAFGEMGDPVAVCWPDTQSASMREVTMPKYATKLEEG